MSETLVQDLTGQELLDAQIYALAERMREYDRFMPEFAKLRGASAAYEAQLQEVDPGIPLEEQPSELATAALGLYITKNRHDELNRSISALDHSTLYPGAFEYYERKLKVESLDPAKYKLGTTKRNEYGQEDGLSKFYTERIGRFGEIMLNASDGGMVRLRGRNGKLYHAAPIIKADYTPAFKLTLL